MPLDYNALAKLLNPISGPTPPQQNTLGSIFGLAPPPSNSLARTYAAQLSQQRNNFSPLGFMIGLGGSPSAAPLATMMAPGLTAIERQALPRIVSSPQMQEAVLRNEWARNGRELDFEDAWATPAGQSAWKSLVKSYNKTNGTNFDPDNVGVNRWTQPIFDAFDKAFLAGRKAPFPGVQAANSHFEEQGQLGSAAYVNGSVPDHISELFNR